jgi:hypothetical protein
VSQSMNWLIWFVLWFELIEVKDKNLST